MNLVLTIFDRNHGPFWNSSYPQRQFAPMFFQNVQPSFQNNNTSQAQEIRHFLLTMPETADKQLSSNIKTTRDKLINLTFLSGALTWSHPTLSLVVPKPKVPKTCWLSNGGSKISSAQKWQWHFLNELLIYWMHAQLTILLFSGYQASVEFWRHAGGF